MSKKVDILIKGYFRKDNENYNKIKKAVKYNTAVIDEMTFYKLLYICLLKYYMNFV